MGAERRGATEVQRRRETPGERGRGEEGNWRSWDGGKEGDKFLRWGGVWKRESKEKRLQRRPGGEGKREKRRGGAAEERRKGAGVGVGGREECREGGEPEERGGAREDASGRE